MFRSLRGEENVLTIILHGIGKHIALQHREMYVFSSLVLAVLFMVNTAVAQTGILPPQSAPSSPAFLAWQRKTPVFPKNRAPLVKGNSALGYIPPPFDWSHLASSPSKAKPSFSTPSSYDLRRLDFVTSVKHQGTCGNCWAYGTYGALESWVLSHLSEQCDFSESDLSNNHGYDWGPCEGGNADMSTAYLVRGDGPIDQTGGDSLKYVKMVTRYTGAAELKAALMTHGSLLTRMYWTESAYNSASKTYCYSGSTQSNHVITLVGWDDAKYISGVGSGAWIIKNSWGTGWGEEGYFYISYSDGSAVKDAVAFHDAVPKTTYDVIYQYDTFGHISSYSWGDNWGANRFTAVSDGTLEAVGLYALADNTTFEIRIYDTFMDSSFSELLHAQSGSVEHAGYHTIAVSMPVPLFEGDDFAITVKFSTPGYGFPIPLEKPVAGYCSAASANPGESFISYDGVNFYDLTDYQADANVCIKGLAIRGAEGENEGEGEGEGGGEVAHPADLNMDWQVVLSEAVAYLTGWQQGSNPLAYAIRAAFLWQNGEKYQYDAEHEQPLCWALGFAEGELVGR